MRSIKITHLTSVHKRYDTRIFLKQCRSLAEAGYDVSLVVADGKGDERKDGVNIYDVGSFGGRVDRMTRTVRRVLTKAKELNAEVYHLHDPELIPVGLFLKRSGKKVIFDSHEDVPKQLLGKHYLNRIAKFFLSKSVAMFEGFACSRFDAIIAATPFIRDKFLRINPNTIDINNFPILDEFKPCFSHRARKKHICYIGTIEAGRGIREMVKTMELLPVGVRLQLGGLFNVPDLEQEVQGYPGWSKVDQLGWLDRKDIEMVLKQSSVGLVALHPSTNYLDSLPVKMFEYMSAGVPVVASNFPAWRNIIETHDCGICVDPLQPEEIASAVAFLLDHPDRAAAMGKKGHEAVKKKYNWHQECLKLQKFYDHLLTDRR